MFDAELEYEDQGQEPERKVADPLKSIESEMCVLGAMMLSRAAWEEALETLEPFHFWRPAHQVIFSAMAESAGEGGADIPLLKNALGSKLAEVGGTPYLIELADYCPAPANVDGYAKVVLGCWYRRKILEECKAIAQDCMNPALGPTAVRERASVLTELPRPSANAWIQVKDIVTKPGSDLGVTTGFPILDSLMTTKGYPKGQVTIIAALEKGGKTTFMLSSFIALSQTLTERVGYATFADLNAQQLRNRINQAMTGYPYRPSDPVLASQYDDDIRDVDMWNSGVYRAGAQEDGSCVETFAAWLKAEHKKKPFAAFFLDYAQEIQTSQNTQGNEVRQNAITSEIVTRLSETLGIAIIVGSQLSGVKDGNPVTRWSRAWMAKCGWMLWVQHDDETNECDITVWLSRFGPQKGVIPMKWDQRRLAIR